VYDQIVGDGIRISHESKNMIHKINKEKRRSMNAIPIRHSNKNQWQGAQADPKSHIEYTRAQFSHQASCQAVY
jgi:hypothetical protein